MKYWLSKRAFWMALCSCVTMTVYVARSSSYGYWLDSQEFLAAGLSLGIAHPPGHPLASLAHYALSLLPLGPLGFRVAVVNGILGGICAALFWLISFRVLVLCQAPVWTARVLSFGIALFLASREAFAFQAIRPEVYALQSLLVAATIERLLRGLMAQSRDVQASRSLVQATFFAGLALANHHFISLMCLPAWLWVAGKHIKTLRESAWVLSSVVPGIITYMYLPLRAVTDPVVNLGEPTSVSRFWWVFTAAPFQKSMDLSAGNASTGLFDVVSVLGADAGYWIFYVALLGIYIGLRSPRLRNLTVFWLLLSVPMFVARGILGHVINNPDALGYLQPVYIGLVGLSLNLIYLLNTPVRLLGLKPLVYSCVLFFLLFSVQGKYLDRRLDLSGFSATHLFERNTWDSLPSFSQVLLYQPQTVFNRFAAITLGERRPDIQTVAVPFIGYPGSPAKLLQQGFAREALREYLLSGEFSAPSLRDISSSTRTFTELDPLYSRQIFDLLKPAGLLFEILPEGAMALDQRQGSEICKRDVHLLKRELGQDLHLETKHRLLWNHYIHGLYFAAVGDFESGYWATQLGLKLDRNAKQLVDIQKSILADPATPLDPAQFLPVE